MNCLDSITPFPLGKLHIAHEWCPVRLNVEVDLVEGTLGEPKKTARKPKQVTPKLRVVFHDCTKSVRVQLFVGEKVVDLTRTIIDKTYHRQ